MKIKKKRPDGIAFDVIETLFSLDPISDRLASQFRFQVSTGISFGSLSRAYGALEVDTAGSEQ